jgi:hypothetical protein
VRLTTHNICLVTAFCRATVTSSSSRWDSIGSVSNMSAMGMLLEYGTDNDGPDTDRHACDGHSDADQDPSYDDHSSNSDFCTDCDSAMDYFDCPYDGDCDMSDSDGPYVGSVSCCGGTPGQQRDGATDQVSV